MAPSPAGKAIDSLVAEVLVPPLRRLGFRKKARHWSHSHGDVHRGVTVQLSQFNVASDVRFTVEVGVSYESLGHPRPSSPGAWTTTFSSRLSGLRLLAIDDWFAFDLGSDSSIDAARFSLAASWKELGEPFLHAAESPERLCDRIATEGNVEIALRAIAVIAKPLGDRDRHLALVRRASEQAAQRDRWRFLPDDPHPLELGLSAWAAIAQEMQTLELSLTGSERAAASAVLEDAKAGMLTTKFHSDQDVIDAQLLQGHLAN